MNTKDELFPLIKRYLEPIIKGTVTLNHVQVVYNLLTSGKEHLDILGVKANTIMPLFWYDKDDSLKDLIDAGVVQAVLLDTFFYKLVPKKEEIINTELNAGGATE